MYSKEHKMLKNPRRDCFAYSCLTCGCEATTNDSCDKCKFYKKNKNDINRNEKLRAKLRGEN